MTLRHIVSWKLSGETRDERDRQAVEIITALSPLRDSVPSVRSLSVHRNELHDGTNFDVTLVAEFDDAAGLAAYASHPEHVVAGAVPQKYAVERAASDFTV